MVYANVSDVARALDRPVTDADEIARVNAYIGVVERMIERRVGSERFAALEAEDVGYVIGESVARRIEDRGGKRNERIDDYSYGLTEEASRMGLFLTDDEWALILPRELAADGAFTITPYSAGPRVSAERLWEFL